MKQNFGSCFLKFFLMFVLFLLAPLGFTFAADSSSQGPDLFRVLENQRLLLGMVEEIRGTEVRVNTGDLRPRYLSLRQAAEKNRTTPRVGDMLLLIVNDQNNVIEYHVYGEEEGHVLIKGKVVKPMNMGQEWALIQFHSGKVKTVPIDSSVRTKMAALPVGAPAVFLLDSTQTIIDVTF